VLARHKALLVHTLLDLVVEEVGVRLVAVQGLLDLDPLQVGVFQLLALPVSPFPRGVRQQRGPRVLR
jgi:hypothetical protein